MTWIVVSLVLLGAFVAYLSLMATVGLIRTRTLTVGQKIIQGAIAWLLPIIGARLVVHFLSEQDIAAIPERWAPNDTVNHFLLSALGVPAREMTRFAGRMIQHEIYESVAEHFSSSSGKTEAGSAGNSSGEAGGSGD